MSTTRHYSVMVSEILTETPEAIHLHPIDVKHPRLDCTVSAITGWFDNVFPNLTPNCHAWRGMWLLPDAVRALDLYGGLFIRAEDADGKKYRVDFIELN